MANPFLKQFQHLEIQLEEIKSATNTFDKRKIIGEGGFGKVYRGVLTRSEGESMDVAFKRLDSTCGQGNPEFLKEIVMLSHYRHENIISLVGFCDENGEKILVYEYASLGSLDRYVSSTTLPWSLRLKICHEAAKGLCYLHDPMDTNERIIHRDIKSSNILLDENWNAKISDMGLSKIGSANQLQTFLVSDVAGTFGYVDPLYLETSILTKESDVYSFGVVLLEVLCGTLCFKYKNVEGNGKGLVTTWKKSYKKNFHIIIFGDLKQQMYSRSLEIFSAIAYKCLKKSRGKRPTMYQVVEELDTAFRLQEGYENMEPPNQYEEIIKHAVPPLVYESEEELKMLLSKGIFLNQGKTWICVNKNGQPCEMISAAECYSINGSQIVDASYHSRRPISRFKVDYKGPFSSGFKIHVKPQFFTPHITYAVNLSFIGKESRNNYLHLKYKLSGERKFSTLYIADRRGDAWLTAELYQFTSVASKVDLEIEFQCSDILLPEGIEFQPVERVKHEMLEDEEVEMQTVSHSDAYWEQKLPSDYISIIKWLNDGVQWTTAKELYSIFCKGFLIENGEQWFSLSPNGKNCILLPAKEVLVTKEWNWRSSPSSRFEEVAYDPLGNFSMCCKSTYSVSPESKYGIYLVYKLKEHGTGIESPVKVTIKVDAFREDYSWYIYLRTPQTPVIRPKFYEKTHNPRNKSKMEGLPQKRNDGWMEVKVWQREHSYSGRLSMYENYVFTIADDMSLRGLIVQGVELRSM